MRGRTGRLIGRADEFANLVEGSVTARNGTRTVVVVEGEPGIGKTRLVAELAAKLQHDGALVATGRGVPLAGGALPYGVAAGLIRDIRTSVGIAQLRAVLGGRAATVAMLDPALGPAVSSDRAATFEAVRHLVTELSRDQLVCLLLEDLHWSDVSSMDLVTFLATDMSAARLLVVATTRSDTAGKLADLASLGQLLTLGPLTDEAARELASEALADPAGEPSLDQVVSLGQGNPLFLEELVASQTTSPSGVPIAIALGFGARLAGISDDGRRLLEALAVAGDTVPASRLEELLGGPRGSVAEALTAVSARGLVDDAGAGYVRFHHELLRRAVTDTMSSLVRAEWHRRWASTLERHLSPGRAEPAGLAALAHHWLHAGDVDRAVPAAVAAARAASSVGAATESATLWHQALSHWDEAADPSAETGLSHEEALIEGTTVLRLAGAYVELRDVLSAERAKGTTDDVLRLWLDLVLSHVSGRLGDVRPHVVEHGELEAVVDRLAAEPHRPVVRGALFWLWWDAYDAEEGLVAKLLDLLEAQTDPEAHPEDLVGLRIRRARHALAHGHGEQALELVRDALAGADAVRPVDRPVAEALEVWVLYCLGRFHECVVVGERVLSRLGDPAKAGMNWASSADNLACAHLVTGNLRRAEELMRTIMSLGDPLLHVTTASDLVSLLALTGRHGEAQEMLTRIDEVDLPGEGTAGYRFGWRSQVETAHARAAAARGEVTTARDHLRPLLLDPHLTIDSEYLWSTVLDAARLFEEPVVSEPIDERRAWGAVVRDAALRVHRYGELGPVLSADIAAHLDRALEQDSAAQWVSVVEGWGSLGAVVEEAGARLRLGDRLALDGDRAAATSELAKALAVARSVGAVPLVERILATGRRRRLALESASSADRQVAGLTLREVEVLTLLADGRTNHQISAELFMSPKTASVHVSRIITKLGVTNRTEAAAYAHRHGLA